ncbi:Hsp20/alpha crystallin family protein [Burkholderia pseudomallei]|uniref:Hsp20/alpha crystallin family protein n=1 Tax=Burkholderia pseudomallei TaxID=28450 RepID=UPI000CDD9E40|nr:Hsp20/alpha crystallin family protein [Burkholderia pseudomallei]
MSDRTELATRNEPAGTAVATPTDTEAAAAQARTAPAVDVFENRHGITLYADLPGVPREKLDVRVQDGNLTRSFALSPDFDVSRIDAQLRDGVLKLTIPRRDEAKPRRIEVSAG